MIDLYEIEETIAQLEAREESMYVCERLAWLYIVRDHLRPKKTIRTQELEGSEFLELASNTPYPELMKVLDEHMEVLKLVQPKEYEAVMAKVAAIKT